MRTTAEHACVLRVVRSSVRSLVRSVFVAFVCSFVCSLVGSFVHLFFRLSLIAIMMMFALSFRVRLLFRCVSWFGFCECCLLVTTLRVHPAVTRLTVYRRP